MPRRKLPSRHAERGGALGIVGILAHHAAAGLGIALEKSLKLGEMVTLRTEPGGIPAACAPRRKLGGKLVCGITTKRVAVNHGDPDPQPPENGLERVPDGRKPGPGGTGHGDNWTFLRHTYSWHSGHPGWRIVSESGRLVYPVSGGRALVVIAARTDLRQTFVIDRHVQVYRPAANLAVFDVVLHVDGAIDQQLDSFSAIRTIDLCFFPMINESESM